MQTKTVIGLLLAFFLVAGGLGMMANLSAPKTGGKVAGMEHGGEIGRGLGVDVSATRVETTTTLGLDLDYYAPNDYDIVLTNETMSTNYYPVGHSLHPDGDIVQVLKGQNWTFNFSAVHQGTLNLISNITVDFGDGSSESFDALPPPVRAAAPYAALAYEFTGNWSYNGTYIMQAWLWYARLADDVPVQWTYATWTVVVYDAALYGPVVDQTGAGISIDHFVDPATGIPTAARAHALTDEVEDSWHHSPASGAETAPIGETEKRAYEPAEFNALAFTGVNDLSFSNIIQDPVMGTTDAYYYVFAMYSPSTNLIVWADEGYASDIIVSNLTDYDFDGGLVEGPDLSMIVADELGVRNLTLAFNDDFSAADFDIDWNFNLYSPQVRLILDLWGAYHQISGCTWADAELSASEVAGILQVIDEDFVAESFDLEMPSASSGLFLVDGKAYTYIVDSVTATSMTGYGDYASYVNLTLYTTSLWDAPSTLSTTRTSHSITMLVSDDGDTWNNTNTLELTDIWELAMGVPVGDFDMSVLDYDLNGHVFYIDGEDENGNIQFSALLLSESDDEDDGEDDDDNETDDDNGTGGGTSGDEDATWYESALDWVYANWIVLAVIGGGIVVIGALSATGGVKPKKKSKA